MHTPRHRFWLILLALFLSVSTGFRLADYIVSVNYFAEEEVFDNQGIFLVSAIFMPVLIVPWTVFGCVLMLRTYPSQAISLFCWERRAWFREILGCLLFGLLAAERVGHAFQCFGYALRFYDKGFHDLALDAMFNTIAALGAAYFWACLRALASYRLSLKQIEQHPCKALSQREDDRVGIEASRT